jgi:hypothetical protein
VDYLAHQYPYFSAAQLLLLQKKGFDGDQLQRTALHTAHPLQLHYWLKPAAFETTLPGTQVLPIPILVEKPEAPVEDTLDAAPNEGNQSALVGKQEEPSAEEPVAPAATAPNFEASTTALDMPPTTEAATDTISHPATQTELPPVTFEPYHTVDYFASQGIRLSPHEATNDTLGKQLKSFTEWLKTMKRLPEVPAPQQTDAASERNVEHLAAHSLNTPEVVTESMAEVWLKQGNRDKAIETYNKLSLRNPAKSAYFAAKIESLKKPT